MDPDDLHRALSAEPPAGTARPDAVGIVMKGVRNARRRRAWAGVASSIGAVVVIVVAITSSISGVNRSSAPPEPAAVHTSSATMGPATSPREPDAVSPAATPVPATTASASRGTSRPGQAAPQPTTATPSDAAAATTADRAGGQGLQITTAAGTTPQTSQAGHDTPLPPVSPTPPPQTTPNSRTRTTTPPTAIPPTISTTPGSPSSTAPTGTPAVTFGDFVGSYNHHTSGIQIKPGRTGLIADVIGCCNGTSYPLKFSGPDNGVLVGTVTGPGQIIGAGEGQQLAVGDTIEFRFVPGAKGPILQTTGFPPADSEVWCGTHYDPRCGA